MSMVPPAVARRTGEGGMAGEEGEKAAIVSEKERGSGEIIVFGRE